MSSMFTSWFSKHSGKAEIYKASGDDVARPLTQPPSAQPLSPQLPPLQSRDYALPRRSHTEQRLPQVNESSLLNERNHGFPSPTPRVGGPISGSRRTSTDIKRTPRSEALFDPFTGQPIGLFEPSTVDKLGDRSTHDFDASFDIAREELWANLAAVRTLQAAVAEAHIHMEGGSVGDHSGGRVVSRRMSSTVGNAPGRRPSTSGADWDDEVDDEEAEKQREREEQFSKMPGQFAGRTEAVDKIMDKLDELGNALTTFHSTSTPAHILSSKSALDSGSPLATESFPPIPPTQFTAPGPRFDSSPAIPKRVLTPDRPERQGSPLYRQ